MNDLFASCLGCRAFSFSAGTALSLFATNFSTSSKSKRCQRYKDYQCQKNFFHFSSSANEMIFYGFAPLDKGQFIPSSARDTVPRVRNYSLVLLAPMAPPCRKYNRRMSNHKCSLKDYSGTNSSNFGRQSHPAQIQRLQSPNQLCQL